LWIITPLIGGVIIHNEFGKPDWGARVAAGVGEGVAGMLGPDKLSGIAYPLDFPAADVA
jgi:hypothetical protein